MLGHTDTDNGNLGMYHQILDKTIAAAGVLPDLARFALQCLPLCPRTLMGCARGHFGVVFVLKRLW